MPNKWLALALTLVGLLMRIIKPEWFSDAWRLPITIILIVGITYCLYMFFTEHKGVILNEFKKWLQKRIAEGLLLRNNKNFNPDELIDFKDKIIKGYNTYLRPEVSSERLNHLHNAIATEDSFEDNPQRYLLHYCSQLQRDLDKVDESWLWIHLQRPENRLKTN